ncbi:MAG: glycoside hydrolase family 3 N-terminal domain-containing protein [Chloroherpetonaceae bacterium]|nr:glycoside hydrolase family 3 protein [Chloroherpetonaceae bacterium]MDW8018712.1 glycoside hydrolase family 3 N-terminal domain-containing protein [Chloroherpetonaceae bacterium]
MLGKVFSPLAGWLTAIVLNLSALGYAQPFSETALSKELLVARKDRALPTEHIVAASLEEVFTTPSAWADSLLSTLSLEEKIGQMFSAFTYTLYMSADNPDFEAIAELVRTGKVGGVMFSKGDVYEAAMLANRLQRLAKVPLLISADMEWGLSMRIDRATEFPYNMAIAATRKPEYAFRVAQAIAKEARALGIHQNYAPSVDLNNNPSNPVINTRAFSENVTLTNQMAAAFIKGTQAGGLIATAKHFPGHGDTDIDSHKDLPVLPFERTRLDAVELKPFKWAVQQGVGSVMVGHLALPKISQSHKIPATLSPEITTKILREELGFKGLIVTDAMSMQGVRKHFEVGEAAVRAVLAGNDMILMSPDIKAAQAAIFSAVQENRISVERINASVRKILALKAWLGLNRSRFVSLDDIETKVGIREHQRLAQEVADCSITLLRNDSGILPLRLSDPKKRVLNISLQTVENFSIGKGFFDELQKYYQNTLRVQLLPKSNELNFKFALKAAEKSGAVIVSSYADTRAWEGKFGLDRDQTKFLQSLVKLCREKHIPLILVSFGTPYTVVDVPDVPVYLCAYCPAKVSEIAAVKVITGQIEPKGKLPVTIPHLFPFGAGLTSFTAVPSDSTLVPNQP